jgi:hypothetical protein
MHCGISSAFALDSPPSEAIKQVEKVKALTSLEALIICLLSFTNG